MKRSKRSTLGGLVRWVAPLTLALLIGFAVGTTQASADDTADMLLGLKVRGALLTHLGVDGVRIGVSARDGQVTLAGNVLNKTTSQMAETFAKEVDGVAAVDNQLQVGPPSPDQSQTVLQRAAGRAHREVDDVVLETQVKMQLIQEMGRPAFGIEVEAADGVVTLTGKVPDPIRRALAVNIVNRSEGVMKVLDQMQVE